MENVGLSDLFYLIDSMKYGTHRVGCIINYGLLMFYCWIMIGIATCLVFVKPF